ncbi:MAG TPA: MotA/TolQ/ExbB proton channel family protein [Armatimonadota bacterium]|nr:MotA/TolQ/ExbB proton channel family protein [Armatimonadota bacterium]
MFSSGPMNWFGMIHLDFSTIILALFSLLSVATIIERGIRYRNADIDAEEFMGRIRELLRLGKVNEAVNLATQTPGPVAAVVKSALVSIGRSREEIRDTIDRVRMRQAAYLDKHLPVLGTVGATAPFVGLFGTVMGIMRAFHDIAQAGAAGTAVVAAGIAQALIATAGGLIVAIIAVIAYNFFLNWSGHFVVEMDTAANEIVHLMNAEPAR